MMEVFLFKSSISLALLYLLYYWVLRYSHDHQLNRFIGLSCVLFSCVFLLIPIDSLFLSKDLPGIEIIALQNSLNLQEKISAITSKDSINIFFTIYSIGVILFSSRFLIGIITLTKFYFKANIYKRWGFRVVSVDKKLSPFTFFNVLFINTHDIKEDELNALIIHEQFHRKQWHSIDVLILEILTIAYWFNPVMWLFKKLIKAEHEYMADEEVLKNGYSQLDYQQLLFRVRTGVSIQLGSHLNNNISLKKRFKIMTEKKSGTKRSYFKTILFLPLMFLILIFSSFSETRNKNVLEDIISTINNGEPSFELISNGSENERFMPLFILRDRNDEHVVSYAFFKKLKQSEIDNINIVKGKKAIEYYGKKGRNGVVVFDLQN